MYCTGMSSRVASWTRLTPSHSASRTATRRRRRSGRSPTRAARRPHVLASSNRARPTVSASVQSTAPDMAAHRAHSPRWQPPLGASFLRHDVRASSSPSTPQGTSSLAIPSSSPNVCSSTAAVPHRAETTGLSPWTASGAGGALLGEPARGRAALRTNADLNASHRLRDAGAGKHVGDRTIAAHVLAEAHYKTSSSLKKDIRELRLQVAGRVACVMLLAVFTQRRLSGVPSRHTTPRCGHCT
mmetsp:Transcript_19564/g.60320  ORF Transcript_19564/g.60320 Transcript_19564/m.60320 type:complete len:242 (-) Transcript_19564:294-1019(-)